MISPLTKPGTRIVCIDDEDVDKYANRPRDACGLDGIRRGLAYTVREIRPDGIARCGFIVVLHELRRPRDWGYALERFELAALPKAITDCLEVVDLPLTIEEFKRQDADADARLRMPY